MNWDAIGAIGEIVGSLAVVVTLVYLAIQVHHVKRQTMISSYQHSINSGNDFADQITSSETLAEIIVRGRYGYSELTPAERMRFDHLYARLMNLVESWHLQLLETSGPGPYREEQLRNICVVIRKYCNYPGVREFWREWEDFYSPETRKLVEANLDSA